MPVDLRRMIHEALSQAGGVQYLYKQAVENPQGFLALLGKCVPKEVVGEGGGPMRFIVVTGVPEPEPEKATEVPAPAAADPFATA